MRRGGGGGGGGQVESDAGRMTDGDQIGSFCYKSHVRSVRKSWEYGGDLEIDLVVSASCHTGTGSGS